MQIIIDIPEMVVKQARSYGDFPYDDYGVIAAQAIINGTELPKGHGRLIDADALYKEVASWGMNDYEPSDFLDEIDRTPTIIEKEGKE